jgi:tripartite-type tricarboxylate transporter receptor subunit TctC
MSRRKIHRRAFVRMTAAAALGLRGATLAQAQGYPSQTITRIVPYPPGSSVDIIARRVATALQRTSEPKRSQRHRRMVTLIC